ncbi:MAG: tryptophan-rich sensory protein [Armatimonadota bacterium]|nr:tryptophan-rich sensory protein [Armatimonadota bacterium]
MSGSSFAVLVLFLLVCLAAGGIGSLFTTPAIPGWYAGLNKPAWNPPNWLFAPVWTTLYLMMGTAAWLVWRKAGLAGGSTALALFAAQLVLNSLWSILFFGMRQPGWAFAELVLLWAAILATMVAFWRLSPAAGWLLVPYLAWVTYASTLNFAIWRMN